jgi:hypothetical protein
MNQTICIEKFSMRSKSYTIPLQNAKWFSSAIASLALKNYCQALPAILNFAPNMFP